MTKPVLFTSFRPFDRAENIRAIYNAYNGTKQYLCSYGNYGEAFRAEVESGKYSLMVTDDFPKYTPGKCIMIWHGIQGGKHIGLDQPNHPYYDTSYADRMTYIISAGKSMVPVWSQCTGVPQDRILPLGMPRTDEYIGKRKGDGHTPLADKRSYLFVPTFRDRGDTPFPDIDWDYIDDHLTDSELLVIKAHPWFTQHVGNKLHSGKRKHIIEVSGNEPSAPYLYDCDVVITDYSSIMFDGYLLGKPCILFEKKPGYAKTRGMYLEYPYGYSSRYAENENDLIFMARNSYSLRNIDRYCMYQVADACNGHSCERISSLIDSLIGR